MAKIPTTPKELADEGVHNAVCIGFVDLGTQPPPASKPDWAESRKCYVAFELVDTKNSKNKPFVLSKTYTYSAGSKNLAKDLKGWLGVTLNGFDTDDVLGKPALITVGHSEDGQYANIDNIGGVPPKTKMRKPVNDLHSLYLDSDTFDEDVFNSLSDYTKERIQDSPEYKELLKPKAKTKGKVADTKPAAKGKK